ncbi:MAG: hypothetical protein AAFR04_09805 [Pseudomonadota bacterium]
MIQRLAAFAYHDPLALVLAIKRRLPKHVDRWAAALNMPQVIGGFIFIWRWEGALILAAWTATMLTAGWIHRHAPMSRLIGLCQLWWLPVLPVVALTAWQEGLTLFALLAGYIVITMTVSLAIDAYDLYRYSQGDRTYDGASRP